MPVGKRTGWTVEEAAHALALAAAASEGLAQIGDIGGPSKARNSETCNELRARIFTRITMQILEDFPDLKT